MARVVQVFLKFFSIELLAGLLILIVAQVWSLVRIGEWGTLNWRVAMRAYLFPKKGPDEIALVLVDERSAREWPTRDRIPRDYLAKLIEKIEQAQPRVVSIDVFLGGPGSSPKADSLLSNVLAKYSNIVLGSEIEPEAGSNYYREYRPYDKFLVSSIDSLDQTPAVGHTMLVTRKGVAFGRLPIVRTREHGLCPSFTLATYLLSHGLRGDGPIREAIARYLEGGFSEIDPYLPKVLNVGWSGHVLPISFFGKAEQTFRRSYPAYVLLNMDDELLRMALRDRIVLVGATYRNARDKLHTPIAIQARMDGVEVHANILANYMRMQHIFPPSNSVYWGLTLLAVGVTLFLFQRFLFLKAIEILAGLLAAYWVLAFFAFMGRVPHWVPVVNPTLFAVATALTMIFYRSMKVEMANDEIERLWGSRLAESRLLELEERAITSNRIVTASQGQYETVSVVSLRLHGLLDLLDRARVSERTLLKLVDQFIDVIQEEVVFTEQHQGAADRFFGESMLIFCGVPIAQDDRDEALRATQIAFEVRERFRFLRQSWQRSAEDRLGMLRLGIAVHTGPVVVGAIHNRIGEKEYAVLGETVHIAAALEEIANFSGTDSPILVSGATAQHVFQDYRLAQLPSNSIAPELLAKVGVVYELLGRKYEQLIPSNKQE